MKPRAFQNWLYNNISTKSSSWFSDRLLQNIWIYIKLISLSSFYIIILSWKQWFVNIWIIISQSQHKNCNIKQCWWTNVYAFYRLGYFLLQNITNSKLYLNDNGNSINVDWAAFIIFGISKYDCLISPVSIRCGFRRYSWQADCKRYPCGGDRIYPRCENRTAEGWPLW